MYRKKVFFLPNGSALLRKSYEYLMILKENINQCSNFSFNINVIFIQYFPFYREFEPVHTKMMKIRECILVVAIDVGTSSSGYAYSFRNDYMDDPLKIRLNHDWEAGFNNELSLKAPTCVLLNPEKEFLAF